MKQPLGGRRPAEISEFDIIASLQAQQQRLMYGLRATSAAALISGAKQRARAKGIAFDLDEHIQEIQVRLDAGVCELSGEPIRMGDGPAEYNSPSIDRIVPEVGYVYSNIRIICHGLNCALGNWGQAALVKMVGGMLFRMSTRRLLRLWSEICGCNKSKPPGGFGSATEWRENLIVKILGGDGDIGGVRAPQKRPREADGDLYSECA